MTTIDEETKAIQIEAIVRRARVIAAEIRSLTETKNALEAKLDSLVDVGWKAEVDGIPASKKTGNRSFSPALAIARMTAEQKLACVSTSINNKTVREIADTEGWTEECMAEPDGKTRIVLS